MSKTAIGIVAIAAMIGAPAMAADMPLKAPPAPPPVVYDWTGFYLGGFDSFNVNHSTASTPPPGVPGGTHTGAVGIVNSGWGGGVTAGANLQVGRNWLIGVEADIGSLGGNRFFRDWDEIANMGSHPNWAATVRARTGFVTGPSLLYVTGGVAFVNVTDSFGGNDAGATIIPATSSRTTQTGAVIGAGIETKLSRNWSAKTEYEYIDGGHHSFQSNVFGVTGTPTVFYHDYQVIKSGLNYRFNGDWDGVPVNRELLASNHNWNGFYVGGNAGVGATLTQTHNPNTSPGGDEDPHNTGFTGGGQVGYNYMFMQRYLIGLEGDFGALSLHSLVADWFDTGFATFQEKTTWYGTARVRAGVSTGPALLYLTGGGGWTRIQEGFGATGFGITGQLVTRTGSGWAFGGGTEVALDAHWSAKLESLVINAGNSPNLQVAPAAFFTTYKDRFMVVRAGLNYALN
jgi:outer membrane immunogenic protein